MMSDSATISVFESGIKLRGELVFASVSDLLSQGEKLLSDQKNDTVEVDLAAVSRIDSAGLALLIEWKRAALKKQQKIKLLHIPKQATSLIETYKLQPFFE